MAIRIKAKTPGFRRCGVAHPAAATEYPAERFTPAELLILQAEPELHVEVIPDADAGIGGSDSADTEAAAKKPKK